jgi:hypothetical protein
LPARYIGGLFTPFFDPSSLWVSTYRLSIGLKTFSPGSLLIYLLNVGCLKGGEKKALEMHYIKNQKKPN